MFLKFLGSAILAFIIVMAAYRISFYVAVFFVVILVVTPVVWLSFRHIRKQLNLFKTTLKEQPKKFSKFHYNR